MPAVFPSGLENARELWITKQVGGLSRLIPHPRPALNDTFSIAKAAGLPRQVKQGKRQRSDTRKQSVNPKWRRATPLLRATGERDPPPARRRLALEAWTPQSVPLPGLRPSREREGASETGAGREVGPACGKSEESRIARRRTSETAKLAAPKKIQTRMTTARPHRGAAPVPQGPLSPRPGSPRNLRAAR